MALERFEVSSEEAGILLDRFLRGAKGNAPWSKVRAWIERGQVAVDGAVERTLTRPLAPGSVIELNEHGAIRAERRETSPDRARILFHDSQVAVVLKPAGISTEPYDANEKDTLDRWLKGELGGRAPIYVVHRLDKETSGILVFGRTNAAKDHLKNQFRFHTTGRRYLALVHGVPRSRSISSQIVRDRGDGLRGSTDNSRLGRASTTHVRLLEELGGSSLVECRLETGRTHQIRIHLSEAGHPLLGERVYSKGYAGSLLPAPRVMLHAQSLEFDHPTTLERLQFQAEPPSDFAMRLATLRAPEPPAPQGRHDDEMRARVRAPDARASVSRPGTQRAPMGGRPRVRGEIHGKRKRSR